MSRVMLVFVLLLVLATPVLAQSRPGAVGPGARAAGAGAGGAASATRATIAGLQGGASQQQVRLPAPWERQLLHRLTLRAAAQVRQAQGPEAAREVLQPVHRLQRQAAVARQGGDMQAARRRMVAAERARARIVVEVLGAAGAAELAAAATSQAAELDALVARKTAAGEDAVRLQRAQRVVGAQLRQGEHALEQERLLRAMLSSARAAQLARQVLARAG
jgi:hypothetical protein